jgi:hypothetical protein
LLTVECVPVGRIYAMYEQRAGKVSGNRKHFFGAKWALLPLPDGHQSEASLLNDLSAIITAGNASQRRPELFASNQRRQFVVIFNLATTTEDRGNEG